MNAQWLEYIKHLQALAQNGLTYAENPYDMERYQELRDISVKMMAELTQTDIITVKELFANETGYQTPKVDVRSVVFQDNRILLVREKADGAWSLPGGWADVGLSPAEIAVKEVKEEAGLDVKPVRLLAVLDKKCHPHPPSPYHTYKIFFKCEFCGGSMVAGMETSEVRLFERNKLPQLSSERNTVSQLEMMFELNANHYAIPIFD